MSREGEVARLTDSRRELAEANIGIAKAVALRMAGSASPADLDDLIGVTLLGLVRAAARFDDCGVPFSSYAYPVCFGLARNAVDSRRARERRRFDLDDRDLAREPAAVGPDPEEVAELGRHLARLTDRERRAVELSFGLADGRERSLQEVGEALGCTKQRAHQVRSGAMAKLRRWHGVTEAREGERRVAG